MRLEAAYSNSDLVDRFSGQTEGTGRTRRASTPLRLLRCEQAPGSFPDQQRELARQGRLEICQPCTSHSNDFYRFGTRPGMDQFVIFLEREFRISGNDSPPKASLTCPLLAGVRDPLPDLDSPGPIMLCCDKKMAAMTVVSL